MATFLRVLADTQVNVAYVKEISTYQFAAGDFRFQVTTTSGSFSPSTPTFATANDAAEAADERVTRLGELVTLS